MDSGLLINAASVVTCRADGSQSEIHPVESGAVAWRNGRILWVGPDDSIPPEYHSFQRFDALGRTVVPGLVDCHTHLAFGGWRADEFAARARGESYLDIARRGGGIQKSVAQTRRASEVQLLDHSRDYMWRMIKLGVTTIECKSGYGLSLSDELKILRAYESLRREGPCRIVSTFLGAHVVPVEYKEDREAYVNLVCDEMLPAIAENDLATFCDVFVEEGAFSHAEAIRILTAGKQFGMIPKLHVDQLGESGGAQLAADVSAISADHLEYVSDRGIDALQKASVTPVALPIASLYLRQTPLDARRFIDRGIDVAVATDFNPGSAPAYHLPLAMTLAATMNRMTPAEALKAVTVIGARAIGREVDVGSIEVGKLADMILVDTPSIDHWVYQFAPNRVDVTIIGGVPVWISETLNR